MFAVSHEKLTLPNGLEVVLHEDHSLPIVAVNVWYHVGSKDEDPGRTGFAHLFEHVMFEGSKHHNRNYFEPLQKVGGVLNGSTTSDRTNYWETVPGSYLDLALWLEADRMGFLLDALDQERFDIQRDVVKNERRQSYENRPYGLASLRLQTALFPSPHPYSWPVIGSQEDLDAAKLDDIKDFFRRFYAPSNASISLAGDFDRAEAAGMIERYFGDIPPGPAIDRVGRMGSALRGEVRVDMRDKVQLPRVSLVWPSVPMFDAEEAPLDVLATILGDGKSSRLYSKLVYDKQVAREVRVGHYSQEIAGEFNVQVTASPGHDLEESQDIVEAELERIRQEPPSDAEIERAWNRIESHHVRYLERFGGFGGRADQLNHFNVFSNDPGAINTDLERYRSVSSEDVVRVARSILGGDRVRLTVMPEEPKTSSESTVDRSVMPVGSQPKSFAPPVPRRERLSNGLNVLYIEKQGVPLVALGLVLRPGATADPADRPGLSHMTASMLQEGTTSRSSQQIAEEMEFLGSHLDSDASREHLALSADALSSQWPTALELMADVVKNPTFPGRELERVRRERLADLKRMSDDPVSVAHRAARALVYGPDSMYGHPVIGNQQSVEALTRDDAVGHFNANYGPDRATLIVVGDVTGDEVMSAAEAHLGEWSQTGQGPDGGNGTAGDLSAPTTIYINDRPGAAQSVIRAGHLTLTRHDPEYHAMTLVNYVFGGHPVARLFLNLRQDKGYSYGYYSTIDWHTGPSVLFAGGSVQTAVTKEAVVETLKEFADISGGRPVDEDEFVAAKDGMFRSFPSQFETQGQLAHQLSRLVIFDLPDDDYSHVLADLDAVTLEELHRVAAERISDRRLTVLVVGDREVVEPGLRELGHPIVHVDSEGRRLS